MEPPFERPQAGAVPPLDHQIGVVDAIVLAVGEGASAYLVREVWKGHSTAAGSALALDTRMHELLGYEPVNGGEVVLFLLAGKPLEVLPVVGGRVVYAPHDASVQETLAAPQLKERVMATATPLSQPLPPSGVRIALRVAFTGVKGMPVLALAHNNAAPLLVLFEDHLVQRVIFRRERKYSEIEQVDVSRTDSDNLEIAYRGRTLTFAAKMAQSDLVEVLRFFQRKGVTLGEGAARRVR
ncbi:MAG TPA: hypothetical protein VHP37_25750 [Burkholderiales bacterium]|nr:hypothetical protein [Burkholderiales bacterium]